jgi:hypothetical protein
MKNSEADKLLDYYASNRASAILSNNREIGRLFAEYKDKLVIIDGENKKEHEYLIPKTKVDRYDDKYIYFNNSTSTTTAVFNYNNSNALLGSLFLTGEDRLTNFNRINETYTQVTYFD